MWKRFRPSLSAAVSAFVMSLMAALVMFELLCAALAIVPSVTMKDLASPAEIVWMIGTGLFVVLSAFRSAWRNEPIVSVKNWLVASGILWLQRSAILMATMLLIAAALACFSADWRASITGRLAGERIFQELPTRVWIARLERGDEAAMEHALRALAYADKPADQKQLNMHSEQLVPRLVDIIESPQWQMTDGPVYAIEILGRIGPLAEPAIPALEHILLAEGDYAYQGRAASALGQIGVPAIPSLIRGLLSSRNDYACRAALRTMPVDTVPALIEVIKSRKSPSVASYQDGDSLSRVMLVLSELPEHSKAAIPVLIDVLAESELKNFDLANFYLETARTLRILQSPADLRLIEMLRSTNEEVRILAAQSLEQLPPSPESLAAIPVLISGLEDEMEEVRRSLACALGHLGTHATMALPALKARLEQFSKEDGSWTQREIAYAIWQIGGQSDLPVQILLNQLPTDTREPNVDDYGRRSEAIEYLGRIGPAAEAALPRLLELAGDGHLEAMHAIRAIDPDTFDEQVIPIMLRILKRTGDSELRSKQRDLLQELPAFQPESRAAVPAVAALLRQGDYNDDFSIYSDNALVLDTLSEYDTGAQPSVPQLVYYLQSVDRELQQPEALELLAKLAPWKAYWFRLRFQWWGLLVPPILVVLISLMAAALTDFVSWARSLSEADNVLVHHK